ncbi:MAG TPA: DegV family protein [Solirubrobacterales bacterium]|nr:DegV family protein [Solirubrobacterales bacterium]
MDEPVAVEGRDSVGAVAVVTDSTTYLPEELIARWQVERVNLYVGWGDDHRSEPEYEIQDFYDRLRSSEDLPSTSQPSVGDFLACYEPLAAAGRDVVSIHIAAGLSGTCESAREAARMIAERGLPGRVEVVDAETGAGGLGCLVLAAAEAAAAGKPLDDVVAATRRTREGLEMWFCLDTLEYLRRGGRIGAAQALVGSALRIKPILTFGTEIAPVGRVRTHRRAMERMAAYLEELHERSASAWFIQHAQSPQDAESMVAKGRELFGTEPLFCTEVGPVLGAHLGSGLLVGGIGCGPAAA